MFFPTKKSFWGKPKIYYPVIISTLESPQGKPIKIILKEVTNTLIFEHIQINHNDLKSKVNSLLNHSIMEKYYDTIFAIINDKCNGHDAHTICEKLFKDYKNKANVNSIYKNIVQTLLKDKIITKLSNINKLIHNFSYDYLLDSNNYIENTIIKICIIYLSYILIESEERLAKYNDFHSLVNNVDLLTDDEDDSIKQRISFIHIIINILFHLYIKKSDITINKFIKLINIICSFHISMTNHTYRDLSKDQLLKSYNLTQYKSNYIMWSFQQLSTFASIRYYNTTIWSDTIFINGINPPK